MKEEMDHSTFQEYLDLEVDGSLGPIERQSLASHVSACEECRVERRSLQALGRRLEASRVAVPEAFTTEVMSRLPVAGWEARSPRTWALPLAVLALFATVSAAFVGLGSAQLQSASSAVGLLAVLGDLLTTATLAGAGLLSASWKGLGLVVESALVASTGGQVVFALLVISLNLFLFSLLRRRRRGEPRAAAEKSPGR